MSATATLIQTYYDRFNAGERDGFLALLTDDVIHDINQGGREQGKVAFRRFLERMDCCYRERVLELVVLVGTDPTRAAAEFIIEGTYLQTDTGLPVARGQAYRLPVGAFFTVRDGLVARISNFYNLQDWLRQVQ